MQNSNRKERKRKECDAQVHRTDVPINERSLKPVSESVNRTRRTPWLTKELSRIKGHY
jgi:hypothetical protein